MIHKNGSLWSRDQLFDIPLQEESVELLDTHNIISHHPVVNSYPQETEKRQSISSYHQVNSVQRLPPPASRRLPPRSALKVVVSTPDNNLHSFSVNSVSKNFKLQQERARKLLVNLLQEKMKELIKLDTRHAFHLPGWNVGCVDEFEQENNFDEGHIMKSTHEITSVKRHHEVLTLPDLSRLMYRVCSVAEFKDAFRSMIKRALKRVRHPWRAELSYIEEYLIQGLRLFRDIYYIDQSVSPWLCARDFASVNLCKNFTASCKFCNSSLNSQQILICNLCHDMYHALCVVPFILGEKRSQETFFCRSCEALLQNQQYRQIRQETERIDQQMKSVKQPRAIDIGNYFGIASPNSTSTPPSNSSSSPPPPPYTILPTFEVDRIVGRRLYNKALQYKVKWKNRDVPSWTFSSYMYDCEDLITAFEQKYADLIRFIHGEQLVKTIQNSSS